MPELVDDGREVRTFLVSGTTLETCNLAEFLMIKGGPGINGPLWMLLRAANKLGLEGAELERVSTCPRPLDNTLEVELRASPVEPGLLRRLRLQRLLDEEEGDARAT